MTLPSATRPEKRSRIARDTASSEISPLRAAKPPSSAAFAKRARCARGRARGRHGKEPLAAEARDEVREPQRVEALCRVDQDEDIGPAAAEDVHLMEQRGVLDDQRVGLHYGLARADLAVVDATEGDNRGAHPLRAEAGKRLRVAALVESGQGQHLRGRYDPLATATMDAHLEHS